MLENPLVRSLLAWLTLALAGCATVAPQPHHPVGDGDGGYGQLMAMANTHAAVGETDLALAAFAHAATSDPARKEPWLRIAHLRAGNGEPAQAMLAAAEVLRRDPTDAAANDIYLAGGLQIASDTLQRLRASDASRHAQYRPQAQALLEMLAQVYAMDELLPEDVRTRLAQQAVEQWQAEHPQPAEQAKPPTSPLDILGGD